MKPTDAPQRTASGWPSWWRWVGISVLGIVVVALAGVWYVRRFSVPLSPVSGTSAAGGQPARALVIRHPPEGAVFPRDLAPVLVRWDDTTGADRWRVTVELEPGSAPIEAEVAGTQWRPDAAMWERITRASLNRPVPLKVEGWRAAEPQRRLGEATVRIQTSPDAVEAPLFYREVTLPFIEAVKDPSRIRWRFGAVSSPTPPPVVMTDVPVCGNCHSFPKDGALLAMDVDYANSKGSYVITEVAKQMALRPKDVISWDDFRREDGRQTFGLLSQISPDGRWVVSTVKDRSVFVPKPDLEFSQLFFPIQGILAVYDRPTRAFRALPGADNPAYVQSNPSWSPDGRWIVFARAEAYELRALKDATSVLLRPEDCAEFLKQGKPFQFDLYRIPFNEGRGGKPEPLKGASHNGKSNFFARYSPDGKWIVFCQAQNYMLLQPDSELFIMPAEGGTPRRLAANTARMNSWHSWSPNSRWLVFSSKATSPYTQLYLTHVSDDGQSSPAIWLDQFTAPDRAANIPEFVNLNAGAIELIQAQFLNDFSFARAGYVCEQTSDFDGALRKYRQALELNPENPHAHERMGYVLGEVKGDWPAGLPHCARAVQYAPTNGQARFYYGKALMTVGRIDEALAEFKQALELLPRSTVTDPMITPANVRHVFGLAWAQKGDFTQATAQLQESVRLNSTNSLIRFSYAVTLAQQGKIEPPLAEYRRALRQDPSLERFPLVYELVARNCATAGRLDEAIELATRALDRARAAGAADQVARIRQALESYRQGLPPRGPVTGR